MNIKKSIYSDEYRAIVAKLKEARIKQGLTQNDAAKKFGVGQSFISKVESGQYRLDIVQLKEFAKLYAKPISFFLREK
jgi:transcriptional regulator with XRE-family HTH domain